jgi:hypothetical protein
MNTATVNLFRMFGNGTQQVDCCTESTARALAFPSKFDGDYYTSRGGLLFAAVLYVEEGIPTFYPLAEFNPTHEQTRAAIEESQAVYDA